MGMISYKDAPIYKSCSSSTFTLAANGVKNSRDSFEVLSCLWVPSVEERRRSCISAFIEEMVHDRCEVMIVLE